MDQMEFDKEVKINNEFDYSNIVADVELISYLIQYCESVYNNLLKLISYDEEKNDKLKYEFRNYEYKNVFDNQFLVSIEENTSYYNVSKCKSYQNFIDEVNNGKLKNVKSLIIDIN